MKIWKNFFKSSRRNVEYLYFSNFLKHVLALENKYIFNLIYYLLKHEKLLKRIWQTSNEQHINFILETIGKTAVHRASASSNKFGEIKYLLRHLLYIKKHLYTWRIFQKGSKSIAWWLLQMILKAIIIKFFLFLKSLPYFIEKIRHHKH